MSIENPQPSEQTNGESERLHALKGELLERWRQLPSEHQATIGLVLFKSVVEGEWGAWFTDAFSKLNGTELPRIPAPEPFREVSRADLREAQVSEADIALLTDDDLTKIAQTIHEHLKDDVFWQEIPYVVEHTLIMKRQRGDIG